VIFPTLPLKAGATPSVFVEDTSDRGEDVMGDFSEKETEKENCTLSPSRAGSLRGLEVCAAECIRLMLRWSMPARVNRTRCHGVVVQAGAIQTTIHVIHLSPPERRWPHPYWRVASRYDRADCNDDPQSRTWKAATLSLTPLRVSDVKNAESGRVGMCCNGPWTAFLTNAVAIAAALAATAALHPYLHRRDFGRAQG